MFHYVVSFSVKTVQIYVKEFTYKKLFQVFVCY